MSKVILIRKSKLFTGPNTHINRFMLIEKRFWKDKVLIESNCLSDVIEYVCKGKIEFKDKTGTPNKVRYAIFETICKQGVSFETINYYNLLKN